MNVVGDEGVSHVKQFRPVPDRRGLGLSGTPQHRMLAGERTAAMKASATPASRMFDGVDPVGDRAEEPLRLPANQRLDEVVATRIAAIRRHSGHTSAAHDVFDRNALQSNRSRLG